MVKKILGAIVAVVILVVALAYTQPREVEVTREIQINAPPQTVYPHVAQFELSQKWSPWADRDPAAKYVFEGEPGQPGASMTWKSDKPDVGNGKQTVTEVRPPEFVKTNLQFEGQSDAVAWFEITPVDGGSKVLWGLKVDMGNSPIGRWMGLMMDGWIGKDYEQGLSKLKSLVEEKA